MDGSGGGGRGAAEDIGHEKGLQVRRNRREGRARRCRANGHDGGGEVARVGAVAIDEGS